MRILYISHCVDRNGSTIALANLAKGMIAKGVEVGIVMPEKKDFLYEEFKDTKEVTIFSEKSILQMVSKLYKGNFKDTLVYIQNHQEL